MIKFTKEEISLCKQVAERYRKEIEYGDWMIIEGDPHVVPTPYIGQVFPKTKRTMLPLWTPSDCLEFLRERGWKQGDMHFNENLKGDKTATIYTEVGDDKGMFVKDMFKEGKTLLEACLKAVLAVVKERK